ncbi:MAG: TetR/AcrR family transcriptional regulator [Comamonas sp.]
MFSELAAASVTLDGGTASPAFPASRSPVPTPWPDTAYRAAQRSAKHQAVLAAAARLFCEQGFHAAALDDVAARLQVSKPTLYYYVRSKKALVAACAQQGLDNALQALQSAGAGQSPGQRLPACLAAYAQQVATDFGWCMVRAPEFAPVSAAGAAARPLLAQQLVDAGALGDPATAALLLQAVEGVACTGGRRATAAIAADVAQLLALLCPLMDTGRQAALRPVALVDALAQPSAPQPTPQPAPAARLHVEPPQPLPAMPVPQDPNRTPPTTVAPAAQSVQAPKPAVVAARKAPVKNAPAPAPAPAPALRQSRAAASSPQAAAARMQFSLF